MLSAIQTAIITADVRRRPGASSSLTDERGSSGGVIASTPTGSPVISSSTAAASRVRPLRARKNGLSGSERRATKAKKAGKDAARKSQRQLQAPPTWTRKTYERPV